MTEGFGPDTPACVVAREAIVASLGDVAERVRDLRSQGVKGAQRVHRLRVATRRASAAVRLFHDLLDPEAAERCRREMRRLRRTAGLVRAGDVHLELLRSGLGGRIDPKSPEVRRLIRTAKRQRRKDRRKLADRLTKKRQRRVGRLAERLIDSMTNDTIALSIAAARWFDLALPNLAEACDRAAAERDSFHGARIEVKRFRYAFELLRPAHPVSTSDAVLLWLEDLQDRMGALNDVDELVAMIAPEGEPESADLSEVHRTLRAEGDDAYRAFADWWRSSGRSEIARVTRPMLGRAPGPAPLGARSRADRGLIASAGSPGDLRTP